MNVKDLIPYSKNVKIHPPEQIEKLAENIMKLGFWQPIVIDAENIVVIGHGRLEAARRLGLTECKFASHAPKGAKFIPLARAEDLSEEEIKTLRISDNTLNESPYHLENLRSEVQSLSAHMQELSRADIVDLKPRPDLKKEENETPDVPVIAKAQRGEIYKLGRHRLMCGDSTVPEDIKALMNGKLADMVFTDPPYNIDYNPDTRPIGGRARSVNKLGNIQNDKMGDAEFAQFLHKVFTMMGEASKDGACLYVCHADIYGLTFRREFSNLFKLSSVLIWSKNNFAIGRSDYHWQHEPIIYGWKPGASHRWHGDRSQTTIWNLKRDPGANYKHPTQKPVEVPEKAILNSSKADDIVLDLFGGSGSTLIACEKNNRDCFMMELDPKYIDVIIQRWEDATGWKAEKIS